MVARVTLNLRLVNRPRTGAGAGSSEAGGMADSGNGEPRRSPSSGLGLRAAAMVAVGLLAAILVVPLWVIPFFVPWTELNCRHDSIDVVAGRYRRERYLLGLRVADTVSETDLSRRYRRLVGEPPRPVWKRTGTYSPWYRNSPHYIYHEALWAAGNLSRCLEQGSFTPDAERAAVVGFLGLLEGGRGDHDAGEYAFAVCRMLAERADGSGPVEVADLPTPAGAGLQTR